MAKRWQRMFDASTRLVRGALACIFLVAVVAFAPAAQAAFHLWVIEQIFSNADGTVQFMVLHTNSNGEQFLSNHTLKATQGGTTNTFTFQANLPSSSTGGKRFLIATQGFAALNIVTPDYVVPNGFFFTGAGGINYADADFVNYASLPTDGVTAINRNGQPMANLATNFAGQSGSVQAAPPPVVFGNFQGLWWAVPPGSESGWGVNFNHQGTTIFLTWFTYWIDGTPVWYVASVSSTPASPNTFTGNLFTGTGPPFTNFDPNMVMPTQVGSVTLTFTDANTAQFTYTVGAVTQTKTITRQLFGVAFPTCVSPPPADLSTAINYQDIWWKAPAGSESGWGVNFTHQGDTIFASWFTFGANGAATWFVVALNKTSPGTYTGNLVRPVSGPAFNAVPFDPNLVVGTVVGTATVVFADGNNATFTYTVDGTTQAKAITRQIFSPPGDMCM